MKKFFTISTLSLTALITAQYSLAKKFIYDDQTGLYSEIRDNQNYNNSGQYYSPPVYGQPQQQNGRYYYDTNRDQRIDTTIPRPSWDWEKKAIKFQSHSEQTVLKLKVMILHVFTTWGHLNNGTKLIVTTF
ncbi:hypothetical protein SKM57_11670 [Acinetobacter faecalis]|uniref:hypothetical protein n=1 Tax=Acinetobacter faecalis TaxID=2665161 RepID=UPI002A920909|nr:hypothetical protein [Acinetobacter faecalis]MDY6469240.1 hypothetical protein [Acinetobacter faecalis]